jgi:small GTP-binding protein
MMNCRSRFRTEVAARLSAISDEIQALLDTWHEGHVLREGARIVIAGAPNTGKSTLLNLLAGRERAIVSPHPGTTRDTIEEAITLQGYPLQLVDTAGLRDAPCEIEQEGIRRTHRALAEADLCVCLVDASRPLSPEEKTFLAAHDPQKVLVLLNKIDLGQVLTPENLPGLDCLAVSLQKSPPMDPISAKIIQKVLQKPSGSDHEALAISERHRNALFIALDEVKESIQRLKSGSEADFCPPRPMRGPPWTKSASFSEKIAPKRCSIPFFQGFVWGNNGHRPETGLHEPSYCEHSHNRNFYPLPHPMNSFDVIVIGAGHAGCEAALAAARMGVRTALVTMDPLAAARMSCNPSIGGIAKSHMVFELDALGGEMALNTDCTGIQFRVLNRRKGPAVRANRAQCDKPAYSARMHAVLQAQEHLTLIQTRSKASKSKMTGFQAFLGKNRAFWRPKPSF